MDPEVFATSLTWSAEPLRHGLKSLHHLLILSSIPDSKAPPILSLLLQQVYIASQKHINWEVGCQLLLN